MEKRKTPLFLPWNVGVKSPVFVTSAKTATRHIKPNVDYILLTGKELLDYFETLFQPEMTRYNQGNGPGKWHVDHIKPIAAFDKIDPNWIYEAFHYTNLQPLWSEDNLKKGSIYEGIKYRKTYKEE